MKKLIFILSALSLIACKNGEKATKKDDNMTNAKQTEQTEKQESYDLILQFISKGAGIDHDLKAKFEEGLAKYNAENKVNITPEISHWGREGETNLNFNLKNLSTAQKKSFLSFVKETIGNTDMVHIKNK
ncbi:MAG: hypothetical protein H6587_02855 [Flavobacteriales bacterium]|nr:hypothetical protein [Flavobacteriales bacterium]MCB9363487.1 hypothetical protein [Flavobacteriales bacterium]